MLNTPVYYPYAGGNVRNIGSSLMNTSPASPGAAGQPQSGQIRTFLHSATMKDSRWLTLEVCRQFQRNACTRDENDCKFAHPPPHVEIQYGRVMCCYDSIKGKCQRKDPQCKYLHPPSHLREQLVQNGRNNLFWKSLQLQILQQQQILSAPPHILTSQRTSQPNAQTISSIQHQNPEQPKLIYQNVLTNQQNQNALQFLGIKLNNFVSGVYDQDLLANMGIFQQQTSNCIQSIINTNENNNSQLYPQVSGMNNSGAKRHAIIDPKSGLPIYQTTQTNQQAGHILDQTSSVILDPQIIQQHKINTNADIQLINAIATVSNNASTYGSY